MDVILLSIAVASTISLRRCIVCDTGVVVLEEEVEQQQQHLQQQQRQQSSSSSNNNNNNTTKNNKTMIRSSTQEDFGCVENSSSSSSSGTRIAALKNNNNKNNNGGGGEGAAASASIRSSSNRSATASAASLSVSISLALSMILLALSILETMPSWWLLLIDKQDHHHHHHDRDTNNNMMIGFVDDDQHHDDGDDDDDDDENARRDHHPNHHHPNHFRRLVTMTTAYRTILTLMSIHVVIILPSLISCRLMRFFMDVTTTTKTTTRGISSTKQQQQQQQQQQSLSSSSSNDSKSTTSKTMTMTDDTRQQQQQHSVVAMGGNSGKNKHDNTQHNPVTNQNSRTSTSSSSRCNDCFRWMTLRLVSLTLSAVYFVTITPLVMMMGKAIESCHRRFSRSSSGRRSSTSTGSNSKLRGLLGRVLFRWAGYGNANNKQLPMVHEQLQHDPSSTIKKSKTSSLLLLNSVFGTPSMLCCRDALSMTFASMTGIFITVATLRLLSPYVVHTVANDYSISSNKNTIINHDNDDDISIMTATTAATTTTRTTATTIMMIITTTTTLPMILSWLCSVGVLVSSMLNGFGSVSMPHSCLAGLYLGSIDIDALDNAEQDLGRAISVLNDRNNELDNLYIITSNTSSSSSSSIINTKTPTTPQRGSSFWNRRNSYSYNDKERGIHERMKVLNTEIEFLETLVNEMTEDLDEMKQSRIIEQHSRTPMGRLQTYMGIGFSIILLVKLITAMMNIFTAYNGSNEHDDSNNNSVGSSSFDPTLLLTADGVSASDHRVVDPVTTVLGWLIGRGGGHNNRNHNNHNHYSNFGINSNSNRGFASAAAAMVTQQDYNTISQFTSQILTAFLTYSQVRFFLRMVNTITRRLNAMYYRSWYCKSSSSSRKRRQQQRQQQPPTTMLPLLEDRVAEGIYSPILAALMSCYFVACIVLTKMMLPWQYRVHFWAAMVMDDSLVGGSHNHHHHHYYYDELSFRRIFWVRSFVVDATYCISALATAAVLGVLLGIQRQNTFRYRRNNNNSDPTSSSSMMMMASSSVNNNNNNSNAKATAGATTTKVVVVPRSRSQNHLSSSSSSSTMIDP